MRRDIAVIISAMCDAIHKAKILIGDLTSHEFASDMRTHEAVYSVTVKFGEGEAILQRDYPEVLRKYPEFPARNAIDLRNRLIHGYRSINYEILYDIAKRDLPETEFVLRKMIGDNPPTSGLSRQR